MEAKQNEFVKGYKTEYPNMTIEEIKEMVKKKNAENLEKALAEKQK
jgi:hypothetical protein